MSDHDQYWEDIRAGKTLAQCQYPDHLLPTDRFEGHTGSGNKNGCPACTDMYVDMMTFSKPDKGPFTASGTYISSDDFEVDASYTLRFIEQISYNEKLPELEAFTAQVADILNGNPIRAFDSSYAQLAKAEVVSSKSFCAIVFANVWPTIMMTVSGDFWDTRKKIAYCQDIADRINKGLKQE